MPQDLSPVAWPARTARLSLRPATTDDLQATWAFRRLPEVGRWLTRTSADPEEYAETFLDPDRLSRTLVVERNGDVVGDLMLSIEDAWAQAEIAEQAVGVQAELGWVLAPSYSDSGCGYATEAVAELLAWVTRCSPRSGAPAGDGTECHCARSTAVRPTRGARRRPLPGPARDGRHPRPPRVQSRR